MNVNPLGIWIPLGLVMLIGGQLNGGQVNATEPLRYKIEPKQTVAYTVTITAETPTSVETLSGVIALTGKRVEGSILTLEYSGGLTKSSKAKNSGSGPFRGGFPGRPGGPPIPRSPFDRPDFRGLVQSTSELVITNTGGVESMRGDSQLPYLLGNLALFPFETLPDAELSEWNDGNSLTITSRNSSEDSRFGPRFGPFANNEQETTKTGGGETVTYRVQNSQGKLVTIAKTYTLNSASATQEDSGYRIAGMGTWVFNRELGVSESMDFKSELTVTAENTETRIPMTVNWQRMSEADYSAMVTSQQEKLATLQREAQERNAKQAAAAKEREGKPLDTKEKRQILADLDSSQWPTIANRLRSMKSFRPHSNDFDIALRVKELRSHKVIGVSHAAKDLWEKLESFMESADSNSAPASDDNPFATADEKLAASATLMRQWSDSTGTFKVEAQFKRLDGANVVLQRNDGKELAVPYSRLSAADQEIVDGLKARK